jgi:hypothetical protein
LQIRIMKRFRLVLLSPFVFGCYSYTPITPATAAPGTDIRAKITGAASDRVSPVLGSFDTREVTGNIVQNRDGQMVVDVPLGTRPNIAENAGPLHRTVSLSPADVVSLDRRRLDVTRTSLLVGGILAGVGAGVAVALHSRGTNESGNGPTDPPPINRIPIRVWKFSF